MLCIIMIQTAVKRRTRLIQEVPHLFLGQCMEKACGGIPGVCKKLALDPISVFVRNPYPDH